MTEEGRRSGGEAAANEAGVGPRVGVSHLLALVASLILFGWMVSRFFGLTIDDAYITFRYAANIAQGEGFALNPGEPVEGSSGLLYTYVLALFAILGLPLEETAGVFGLLVLAIGLPVTTYRLHRRTTTVFFLLALSVASPNLVVWSLLGLETMLHAYLVFVFFLLATFADLESRANRIGFAIIGALLLLSRPEGFLFVGAGMLSLLLFRVKPRRLFQLIGWFAVVVAGATAFRCVYFHDVLPNTYFAKAQGLALSRKISGGARYTSDWVLAHWWYPVLLLLAAVRDRDAKARVNSLLFIGAQLLFILVAAGGDWMPLGRHIVPVLPIVLFLIADFLSRMDRDSRLRLAGLEATPSGVVLAAIVVLSLFQSAQDPQSQRLQSSYKSCMENATVAMGRWFDEYSPPGSSIVARDIGALSYFSKRRIIDLVGLTDRHIARTSGFYGRASIDLDYVYSKEPDFIVIDGASPDWRTPEPTRTTDRLYRDPRFCEYNHITSFACTGDYHYHIFTRHERLAFESRVEWLLDQSREAPSAGRYIQLSETYYRAGLYSKSVEACMQALELEPDSADAYNNLCSSYNHLEQWGKAVEACDKALGIDPDHGRAQANLRWAKIGMSTQASFDGLLEAVAAEPSAHNYINLGMAFYTAFEYTEAIDAWRDALRREPDSALTLSNICSAYNHLEEWNKAIEACDEALEIDPDHGRARANLEWAKTGRSTQASIDSLEQTASREPAVESFVDLGMAYYNASKYSEAIDAWRDALEQDPDSALALNNICSAYNHLEEWCKAIKACNEALKIDPGHGRARANLQWAMDGR